MTYKLMNQYHSGKKNYKVVTWENQYESYEYEKVLRRWFLLKDMEKGIYRYEFGSDIKDVWNRKLDTAG